MRRNRLGFVIAAALGCTASGPARPFEDEAPIEAPTTAPVRLDPNAFRPLWYPGDRWVVRIENGPGMPTLDLPGVVQRFDWEFSVQTIAEGEVHIEAVEFGESRPRVLLADKRALVFDTAGRLLQAGSARGALEPVRDLPRVEAESLRHMGMEMWPLFPLEDSGVPGNSVIQRVSKHGDAYEVRVTIAAKDSKWVGQPILIQRWEPGRPWWTSAELRLAEGENADTDGVLMWSGEVTQWGGKAVDP